MKSAVLVVPSTGRASGVVSYVVALAHAVPNELCVIAVPRGSDLSDRLPADANIVELPTARREMATFLKHERGRFPIIQTHGARALAAARMGRVAPKSLEHVFHELPRVRQRRSWVEVAAAVGVRRTANSPMLANRLARLGLPAGAVLPPLVLAGHWLHRTDARERLEIDLNELALAVVGRLEDAKCPILAIDAMALVPSEVRTRATIHFLGDGPLRKPLEEHAAAKGVSVRMAGHVADAAALLPAFDVVVVPSRVETFGISLAEAAAAGIPVAAVESPGSRLITLDGSLLHLADPSPQGLSDAIRNALATEGPGVASLRQHVEACFTVDGGRDLYRAHFLALLADAER